METPQNRAKKEAQNGYLALIAEGVPKAQAIVRVNRTIDTYNGWMSGDPWFRRKVYAINAARKRGEDGLPSFGQFRKLYFDHDNPPHHETMITALEAARPGHITMVLAFPEAAKTTLMADRICYLLGPVDPNHRICVISEGRDLAAKVVNQIQMRMTDSNQFGTYIARYGPFKAPDRSQRKPWNAQFMSVLNAQHDEKEYSLEAKGSLSKIYGGRFNWIAFDDIQSSETLSTTPGLLTYIRQTAYSRLVLRQGRMSVWGSRVGDGDIYEAMLEEDMVDHLVKIPALDLDVPRDEHFVKRAGRVIVNPNCAAKPTWSRYNLRDLAIRRSKLSEAMWARTYMQSDINRFGAVFTEESLEACKDYERPLGRSNLGVDVMCAVDPAMETGICAYVACAYDAEHLWVIDAHESHDTHRTEDILEVIEQFSQRYRPSRWIIEQNNWQKALVRDERLERLGARYGFEVIPHQTSRNKYDPIVGITMMPSSFADDEIRIPWHPDAREVTSRLIEELRAWRPKRSGRDLRQDLVVALWFIWIHWQANKETLSYRAPTFRRPSWMLDPAGARR